jgi:hypothetical protein
MKCVARRLPPIKPAGRIFNWSVFRNSAFSVYCAAQFLLSFGVFIGLSPSQLHLIYIIQTTADLQNFDSAHLHQQQRHLSRNLAQLCILSSGYHQRERERGALAFWITGRSFR